MSLLALEHCAVHRGDQQVLDGVSLHLGKGEMLGILGPNGAGKSSLLRALVGLLPVAASRIELNDEPLMALSLETRARRIGYLPQSPQILWPLSVRELVRLGRRPHRGLASAARDEAAIDAALATFGLEAYEHRDASRLSTGEQMRVHLARLAAGDPSLWLVDEPTAALDPRAQLQVLGELKRVAREGAGVMIVLHDLPLAARYCDRVLVLEEGRAVICNVPALALDDAILSAVFGVRGIRSSESAALLAIAELPEDTGVQP